MGESKSHSSPPLPIEVIARTTAEYYRITHDEILSKRRANRVKDPRQVAHYIAYFHTEASYQSIGERIGKKNHATVLHGVRRVTRRMKEDHQIRIDIEEILNRVRTHVAKADRIIESKYLEQPLPLIDGATWEVTLKLTIPIQSQDQAVLNGIPRLINKLQSIAGKIGASVEVLKRETAEASVSSEVYPPGSE